MVNEGVGSWLHRRRQKSGAKTALIHDGGRLSYGELADRSDRLANALTARGTGRGSRVAYLGENEPAFLETLFAAGLLGAIFVPLNTRLAPPEIRFALQDSGSTVLVHSAQLSGLADAGTPGTAVSHRLAVGGPADGTGTRLRGAPEDYDAVLAASPAGHPDVPVSLEDAAMILYTSGTTGRPKGAVLTHGNMTWNSFNVLVDYDVTSADVNLVVSPMFHVASLGMGVLPVLLKGGTLVLEQRFVPSRALALIEQHRCTMLSGVPTTFQLMAEDKNWDSTDLGSLAKLTCGGSPVPLRVLDAYEKRGLSFSGGYGMTETAPGATSMPAGRTREKAGSVGLPHFFTDVRIAGADGTTQPAGVVGEIQVRGPNVSREYWHEPDATASSHSPGGWFKSGDLGHFDGDGFLFMADRLKDMIISGGENIYPAEVELLINELDGVGGVAVIGVPDAKWGEVPLAVVTVLDGHHVTAEQILGHLQGKLARYKIPKTITFMDELPRTASGKIRKAELRQLGLADANGGDAWPDGVHGRPRRR
jgi:fatty-acyl-CoA synthase